MYHSCKSCDPGARRVGAGAVLTPCRSVVPLVWCPQLSQNIIHARMVAQAGVVVGLCTGAAISRLELPKGAAVAATSQQRLDAINSAHEAAFVEELELQKYEAEMKALALEQQLAADAAAVDAAPAAEEEGAAEGAALP